MPTFKFKAADEKNQLISDTLVAASYKEAETLLKDKKFKLFSLHQEKEKGEILRLGFWSAFPLQEKISFCRYLGVMIRAGLPLSEAFDTLVQGATHQTVKRVLADVSFGLVKGQSLYSSFAKYPHYFGEIFLAMIKAGETSGTLSESFDYLSEQYNQESDLRKKIVAALIYPTIILALMLVLGVVMMTFVLPRLGKVYLTLNLELPLVTKLIFNFSLFLEKNFLVLFLIALVGLAGVWAFFKTKIGKNLLYRLAQRTPIVSRLLHQYNLVRFSQSLSSLLSGGVPISQSLAIASKSLTIVNREKIAKGFEEKINRGQSLTSIFAEAKIFPPLMTQMVAIGEKTGNLEKILQEISSFYREEVESSLKNFITVLEPFLMIVVGITVGAMIIAFISPIYSLIGKLQP